MTTKAVLDAEGNPIGEGLMDAAVTVLCALSDKVNSTHRRDLHRQAQDARAGGSRVRLRNLRRRRGHAGPASNAIKIGIMDEERRTSANCCRVGHQRLRHRRSRPRHPRPVRRRDRQTHRRFRQRHADPDAHGRRPARRQGLRVRARRRRLPHETLRASGSSCSGSEHSTAGAATTDHPCESSQVCAWIRSAARSTATAATSRSPGNSSPCSRCWSRLKAASSAPKSC